MIESRRGGRLPKSKHLADIVIYSLTLNRYEPILSNSNRQTFVIAAPVLFYARNIYVNTVVDGQHNLNDGIYRKLIPILTFVRNEPRI